MSMQGTRESPTWKEQVERKMVEQAANKSYSGPRLVLQEMGDWEKEQAELDAQLAASKERETSMKLATCKAATLGPQYLPKKPKPSVDHEAIALETVVAKEIGEENWVGKLVQYRQVNQREPGYTDTYKEVATNTNSFPRFHTTVTIAESPQPFGAEFKEDFTGKQLSFSNKKISKQYAAMKAINWLIENRHMPADGSVKWPKVAAPKAQQSKKKRPTMPAELASSPSLPTTPSRKLSTKDLNTSPAISPATPASPWANFASQVPELCAMLGFNVPTYRITQSEPNSPLCDGYADFGSDPRIEGRVGQVRNVFGKKNAKEECAKIVVSFLKDIERQRRGVLLPLGENRKRSLQPSGSPEDASKSIKAEA